MPNGTFYYINGHNVVTVAEHTPFRSIEEARTTLRVKREFIHDTELEAMQQAVRNLEYEMRHLQNMIENYQQRIFEAQQRINNG